MYSNNLTSKDKACESESGDVFSNTLKQYSTAPHNQENLKVQNCNRTSEIGVEKLAQYHYSLNLPNSLFRVNSSTAIKNMGNMGKMLDIN